ncbi:MAG: acyl-CoA dehydrogenase family protein [Deltaproteobacteria bacterium]|nr:acyl-CoA dehydrogenase family protein [Deltaproteobacteria bacterium]MBW2086691.1 acyl-CoA dehydrogenase family protein [Deltaproteobacteria bacterium]
MDFGFTEEQERLRKKVREFFQEELPEDYDWGGGAETAEEGQAFMRELQKKTAKQGYLTSGWPKEYDGMGLGYVEQGIVDEEFGYAGISWPSQLGLHLAAPAVFLFGTEEQKKKFIPPLARGEAVWFEAFTEPEAGSDEANQQTRAVQDGDYFILNGQKTFISGIYKPDFLYTLARTADTVPKHRGISLFLIPADLPGITYRALPSMGGGTQNDIFFDNVKVHKEYLLGELNRGFYHAMATFEFERTGTAFPGRVKRGLEEFIQFCKEEKRNGKPLIEDPEVRKLLAEMAVEAEIWKLMAWKAVWWFGNREELGPMPFDLSGMCNKQLTTAQSEKMSKILGIYGQLRQGSKWAKHEGRVERGWRSTRSLHAAGTLEIYKYVIARRGLGLPRIPAKLNAVIAQALDEKK